jgi:hypothetical protein
LSASFRKKNIAENILQDTFLKIWSTIDSYSAEKERLFTWMIAIARNLAKDNQNLIPPRAKFQPVSFRPKLSSQSTLMLSADYGKLYIPLHGDPGV